jgi:ornithine cyclodeaminase/alanine dehydrogenase-like protein (mu-crystallin family)
MHWLGPEALREVLPMSEAILAMETAFGSDRQVPLRQHLGGSLVMPGRVGETTGVKVVSIVPGNPIGVVAVFDETGNPLGMVDGSTLTSIRTGAASGLATRLLSSENATTMAMLGAGAMAFDQVEAIRAVRPIDRILVWSRSLANAEALAERIDGEVEMDTNAAVAQADIVSCATPALEPLFSPSAVGDGTHVNAVGAFTSEMAELPGGLLSHAFVVVDDLDAAAAEAGDLIRAGRVPDATITDLLEGSMPPGDGTTVFKSVGIASQDVAAAVVALRNAARLGLGVEFG